MPSKGDKENELEMDKMNEDLELKELCKQMPITEETECGIGCVRSDWLQRMANKKTFIALYGIAGCCMSSTYAYFNGTITTIEKRFHIPSRVTGVISIGNDITQLFVSVLISYYGGKGHRPRWIASGLYSVALFCFLNALPHALYGPGEDAISLTAEYGNVSRIQNFTPKTSNHLCLPSDGPDCTTEDSSLAAPMLMLIAQMISGIGNTIYFTLGFSYMDDNTKKSKSPAIISFSYFIRTLGPPIGYTLVSACLKLYVAPNLTPVITNKDPRWLGAWWLGWVIQGVAMTVMASMIALLPKTLPRAAARKELLRQKSKENKSLEHTKPSIKDMYNAFKRVVSNKVYLYSHLAGIFYIFGYIPYWIYLPKYIEIQYRQSASVSSFATGAVGFVCSALGILASGACIQKFKPKSRMMAAWNLFIGLVSFSGFVAYIFLGCSEVDKQFNMIQNETVNVNNSCAAGCSCEFTKYSPVCAADLSSTFISACHAGCTRDVRGLNGTKIFTNCSCITPSTFDRFLNDSNFSKLLNEAYPSIGLGDLPSGGVARSGPCPVDCLFPFYCFLGIVCVLKFFGAAGRITSFLISVRCVSEDDKSISIGIGMTGYSLFALMPAPIIFGYILDSACLVWGKTCSGSGNCWIYNAELLRYRLNLTSLVFLTIGNIFDLAVWYFAKTINVYGEESESDNEDSNRMDKSDSDYERDTNSSVGREDGDSMDPSVTIPLQSSHSSDVSRVNCLKLSNDEVKI